jgi:PAS domain S-box-containing protein
LRCFAINTVAGLISDAMRHSNTAFFDLRASHWLTMFLVLFYSNATQADIVKLTDTTKNLPIGHHIEYLEDGSKQLTIDDVSSPAFANRFQASQRTTPNFGYTRSVYWIRFTVQNDSHDINEWYLVQEFPNIHYLDLYTPQDNGQSYKLKQSGNLRPYATRDVADRRIVFKLPLLSGTQKTYYLRVQSGASKRMDLHIWKPQQFVINANWDSLLYGMFYGVLLIMFFYNAILYAFLHDSTYKWLISYIATVFIAALFYLGHAQVMFNASNIGLSVYVIPVCIGLLNITLLKFTDAFLKPVVGSTVLHRMHITLLYLSVAALLLVPLTDYFIQLRFLSPITVIVLSFCLYRCVYAIKNGDSSARWYALAWVIMLLSIILVILASYNFIPVNNFTANSYLFGLIWMVLFMSVALADRVNTLKISEMHSRQALDESESRRQLIMEAGKVGTWLWDLTTHQVKWSEETEQIFGLNEGGFKGTYDELVKFIHPDDLKRVEQTVANTMENLSPYYLEHRIVLPNGDQRWVSAYGKLDLDDQNKPLRLHGTVQDITEYKQTQEELRDSERNYEHLFNSAADGFIIRTLDGIAVDANPAVCEMYDYSKEEFLKLPISKIAHPDTMKLYQQYREGAAEGKSFFTDEAKGIRKDGSLFYLQVKANVIQYQGKPHAFIVLRDISHQKRLQDAIKHIASGVASKTGAMFFQQLVLHLSEAYQSMYAFVGILDNNDSNLIHTLAMCRNGEIVENITYYLQGTPCEIVIGQKPCAYPDNVQQFFPSDQLLVQMGASSYIGAPLFTSQENALGILVVIDDKPRPDINDLVELLQIFATRATAEIERMQAEELLQQRKHHLEDIVATRTAELTSVNKELESFSYSVSHDLRAPLRSMDGFSQVLLEDFEDSLDEVGKDYLRRIRKSAQKMAQLIDDLLLLSRVTRKDIVTQRINLSELVKESINKCKEHEQRQDVKVTIESDLVTDGDPDLLSIAIDNLVSNAWKYTRNTEQAQIEFGAINNKDKVSYYIKDNGAGFDMQYANKLFNAFQRLHSPDEFEGTGIGLATVARIIRRHGGHVWAEGSVGKGAAFYFDLHSQKNMTAH